MERICVFCGSSSGDDPSYRSTARGLATVLLEAGIGLVYGGGDVGLMGAVADAVLEGGGEVIGVIPRDLFTREVAHHGVTELVEVDSMHERKQVMYERSDGFVAMPGGLGTLEELAEIATWAQLGLHTKPVALLDVDGFWQPFVEWLDGAVDAGFLKPSNRAIIRRADSVDTILSVLAGDVAPAEPKWIDDVDAT